MKKNTVNTIFVDEYKRKMRIISYSCVAFVFLVLFVSFLCAYFSKSRKEYVSYTENSEINYKVYLKENEFFDKNYAEEKKQYIASLIKYINADFKYGINVEKDNVDFKYQYYIDASVDVKERNGTNSLYDFKEILLNTQEVNSNGKSNISINENINIDYNHYNEIIKKFVKTYKLDDIVSTLTISLHVETASSCVDFDSEEQTESVVSLVIPLTTKTMAIDITNDLVENDYKIIICNDTKTIIIHLVLSLVSLIIFILVCVQMSLYITKTRSPRDVYERELKKILSNYHSFIQKAESTFDLGGYKIVNIDSFTDMLEIRDTINQPILMVETRKKNGVHFIIPSDSKIVYSYTLKVVEHTKDEE